MNSLELTRDCWLPTLQLAAREVFGLMLGCELKISHTPVQEEGLEITALVGLAGELTGIFSVRCSPKSAARMAARMLGLEEGDNITEDICDAVGEVCNMIAGNFKNKITGLGDGCKLSVPAVIIGGDYNLRSMIEEEMRTILLFEGEPLVISLEIHR